DRLCEGGAVPRGVMAIGVHPDSSGVPHRIGYLERLYRHVLGKPGVLHWTGEQILDWFRTQVPINTKRRGNLGPGLRRGDYLNVIPAKAGIQVPSGNKIPRSGERVDLTAQKAPCKHLSHLSGGAENE